MEFKTDLLEVEIRTLDIPEMGEFLHIAKIDFDLFKDNETIRENKFHLAGRILTAIFKMNLIVKISGHVNSVEELLKTPSLFIEMNKPAFDYFHTIFLPEKKTV